MLIRYLDDDHQEQHAWFDERVLSQIDAWMLVTSVGLHPQGFCGEQCQDGLISRLRNGD